jgi:hypothetical protein
MAGNARRQCWHSCRRRQRGFCKLQILNALGGFESHPLRHNPINNLQADGGRGRVAGRGAAIRQRGGDGRPSCFDKTPSGHNLLKSSRPRIADPATFEPSPSSSLSHRGAARGPHAHVVRPSWSGRRTPRRRRQELPHSWLATSGSFCRVVRDRRASPFSSASALVSAPQGLRPAGHGVTR